MEIFNSISVYINICRYSKLFISQILADILFSPYFHTAIFQQLKNDSFDQNKRLCIIMKTIPSMRFSKTNWLNFHQHHCVSLITNYFKSIIIWNWIAAGLSRYQYVWTKYLGPVKNLNFNIGGNRVQNVLWRTQNLPFISSLKNVVFYVGQRTCSKIHVEILQIVL